MQDSFAFINNLRFHYRHLPGEGAPMVFVHGLASNARIWDHVAPAFAPQFRVFALNQRSHGLTDSATEGFDFASITRDLQGFLETLHLERPILVGHSWGAGVVLHYAATRAVGPLAPQAIALVDGGTGDLSRAPEMTWAKAEQLLMPPVIDGMPREAFLARMPQWMGEWYSETNAAIVLANFGLREDDTIYRRLPIPYHMQIARAIYEQRPAELFPRVRCPILLCPALAPPPHDARAAQFIALKREGVALAAQANPRACAVWFENTAHDIPLHRPAALTTALQQFLQTL
jgi:pimeloyl-ACP methyl ester carboxylesterase